MGGSDTHYYSGDEVRVGDRATTGAWHGFVVFVLASGSFDPRFRPADWSYLGRGFMVQFDEVRSVFYRRAEPDLFLASVAEPPLHPTAAD